ncbi:hypothetical protein [Methanolobus psychrotolerans]|uniref:hypothetical protein n=1 Tax=Methanolobus psychrotolerans TaxID=1874706 RepID=UPI000B91B3C5|nr:hypothetical protein [Methanolobus psychrotolerans]
MRSLIAKKAIDMLRVTKGVENAFLLNEQDIGQIRKLEEEDEQMNSRYFGRKNNIGVKRVLQAEILIAFITNREYDWPKDNLKITYQGEVIGKDVSDILEINRYKNSKDYCVCGNIVINHKKMKGFRDIDEPPMMIIYAKPWIEIENMAFISEALIASPSRLTDNYIKSKVTFKSKLHIGTFLAGMNLIKNIQEETKITYTVES